MTKKIVVIGGGISGLVAAVYGSLAGFSVTVYEQQQTVGGECTGWDRDGYHIDNCIHWLMGTSPGSQLYELWKTVGALKEDTPIHRFPAMYVSELDGQQLILWRDSRRTEREMLALSPADKAEIRKLMRFCRLAQRVQIPAEIPSELMGPGDGLRMMLRSGAALKIFRTYEGMNVQDLMEHFSHPLIRCLISDFTPADSQASSFVMAYGNFLSGDGGIPAGGSRAVAQGSCFPKIGWNLFCGKCTPTGGPIRSTIPFKPPWRWIHPKTRWNTRPFSPARSWSPSRAWANGSP